MNTRQTRLEQLRARWRGARAPKSSSLAYQPTRLDVWLSRAASIAQAGVLVATILGFYYTVIPLYQKAALDELIAKREIELKEAQASITAAKREAYEQRRRNLMVGMQLRASDCSDVRSAFRVPVEEEARRVHEERVLALAFQIGPCLVSVLKQSNAHAVLTQVDLDHLRTSLANLGADLDRRRTDAIARIAALPDVARRDPSVLAPVGPFMQRHYDFQEEARKKLAAVGMAVPQLEVDKEKRFQYALKVTQVKIANDFRSGASEEILAAMRSLQWPPAAHATAASSSM